MSKISIRTGITAEQVNEANAAKKALEDIENRSIIGGADMGSLEEVVGELNAQCDVLRSILGADHVATRKVLESAERVALEIKRADNENAKFVKRYTKAMKQCEIYDGWYVMVAGEKIPVVDVTTENGQVIVDGVAYPFIPVYFPLDRD